jgi:DNA-binding Xre family transcriptional regulator
MTRGRLVMRWNLRQVMATRGLFLTSDLVPLLEARGIHMSRQYVHRLVTKAPQRVNIDLLAALCDALDCGPSDLLEPVVEADERATAASGEAGRGIGDLRPVRAKIRRPPGAE